MAKKIRNLWQKVLSAILGFLGVSSLTSCLVAYGMAEPIGMYACPDPINIPAYGTSPISETIHGTVTAGPNDQVGSMEFVEAEETSEEQAAPSNIIEGINVILYDGNDIFATTTTNDLGEFYIDAYALFGKEVTLTFTDVDGTKNGRFKTLTKTFTLSSMETQLNVTLQPISVN